MISVYHSTVSNKCVINDFRRAMRRGKKKLHLRDLFALFKGNLKKHTHTNKKKHTHTIYRLAP